MSNLRDYRPSGVDWIGHIPTSWRLLRGRFLFESKKEINRDLQCQNLLSLTLFGVLNKDYEATDGLRPENYNSYQIFQKDDLVFKMIDLENVKTSRVGIVHEEGIMSPVYIRHEPVKNKILPRFAYWFYYDLYKKEIYNSIGSGVRSSLTSSDLLELELPVPPLEEQKLISCFLDNQTTKIDSLINKIDKKIELLKEQRTSLTNQYVTKGLDPEVEMKNSGVEWIGDIPKHWTLSRVKWVTTKIGSGITPKGGAEVYSDEGIPFLRSQNIHFDGLHLDEVVFISEEIDSSMSNSRVQRNDILYNITGGSIGRCCLVETDERMNVNQHVCIIRASSKVIPSYLLAVLCSEIGQNQLKMNLTGSGREGLNFENLGNFYIPLIDKDEQNRIGSKIRNLNEVFFNLETKLKTRVERLNEYRQSLISSVVTGKVRVTEEMV